MSALVRTYGLTAKEVAKQYETTVAHVYKLACVHGWKRTRKGRHIYYDVIEVGRTLGQ